MSREKEASMKRLLVIFGALCLITVSLGCSAPLSTREKGAGIGALGGAAAGGIIGSAVRHPAAGALIGGVLGAGGGALIGDQLQGQEQTQQRQQEEIDRQNAELRRQREDLERMKRQGEY